MARRILPPRSETGTPRVGAPGVRRHDILSVLLEGKGGLTADEIAAAVGVTRSAAHQHLAVLEGDGMVERRSRATTRGRPAHVFVLTQKGLHLFPKKYDWLAELVLSRMIEDRGVAAVEEQLAELGAALAEELKQDVGNGSLSEKIERAAGLLEEFGYVARAKETEADAPKGTAPLEIEALNCIFHQLAQKHPEVCTLDLAMLDTALEARTTLVSCMARGEGCCRFRFETRSKDEDEPPHARLRMLDTPDA
jgi:DeoR family suf operon transcriptional repressor